MPKYAAVVHARTRAGTGAGIFLAGAVEPFYAGANDARAGAGPTAADAGVLAVSAGPDLATAAAAAIGADGVSSCTCSRHAGAESFLSSPAYDFLLSFSIPRLIRQPVTSPSTFGRNVHSQLNLRQPVNTTPKHKRSAGGATQPNASVSGLARQSVTCSIADRLNVHPPLTLRQPVSPKPQLERSARGTNELDVPLGLVRQPGIAPIPSRLKRSTSQSRVFLCQPSIDPQTQLFAWGTSSLKCSIYGLVRQPFIVPVIIRESRRPQSGLFYFPPSIAQQTASSAKRQTVY
mmetsp:Transcript_22412/g.53874  ORF Transcript_22412/g.53874 Transcript_22412/m.53874 type:complete len:290 (-) Transcript_22412:1244-2113(-)